MATWTGWKTQLLQAAHLPTTATNDAFLTAWASHANAPNCASNPIDLSHPEAYSANCKTLSATRVAQRYGVNRVPDVAHSTAAAAFQHQIDSGVFAALTVGLADSTLTTFNASADVLNELRDWGSSQFAAWIMGQQAAPPGGEPTHFHQGWEDLRRSINHGIPSALGSSERSVAAALRSLQRARKVRL